MHNLDWAVGQGDRKHPTPVRSRSEPRNVLNDLYDQNMLSERKRDLIKKILLLQRQKFKDNQARKSNDFENSTYSFSNINQSSKTEEEEALLNQ